MGDSKSRIYELCQKENITLPTITHHKIGGTDHQPIWQATVVFSIKDGDGEKRVSMIGRSKNKHDAEKIAFDSMCSQLKK